MPKKKKETLVHLDMDELTQATPVVQDTIAAQTLGDILKKERQKKHWDISDVSKISCIKPVYIEALEKGHYYIFPAKAYAIGFLRTYAKMLKLNPEELVTLYHQETSEDKEEPLDMLVIEKKAVLPSKKTLALIVLVLVIFYVIWYLIANSYLPHTLDLQEVPTVVENTETIPEVIEEEIVVDQPKSEETTIKETPEKDISEEIYTAPVAFLATGRVWVSIKDIQKNKVLVDKVFDKNEHFITDLPLENLSVSTARGGVLDLYINGVRTQTFKKEDNTPLIGLPKD